MNKKGLLGLGSLSFIIMTLVVIGITLVVALRINSGLEDATPAAQTEAIDAAKNATEGLSNIAENQGLLGTIIVFGVILGVVVMAFAVGRGGR
jgi:hypothetical protein